VLTFVLFLSLNPGAEAKAFKSHRVQTYLNLRDHNGFPSKLERTHTFPSIIFASRERVRRNTRASTEMDQISDEDWDVMKAMISTQIDSIHVTVESLRKRGSLECIAQQIKRGDDNPSARLQAWYLAMLEIEVTSKPLGLQKINYLFNHHAKEGLKSFVLDTTMTQTSADADDDEWKRRSIVANLEGKPNLSVVERQQLWQAKKESALNNMRQQEQTKAARERKMSAPDLTKSRKSFMGTSKLQKQSGQKRSGDDGYLNNITNQSGGKNKRIRTDSKMSTAPKSQATRRQSLR